jgi:hypothetical protein
MQDMNLDGVEDAITGLASVTGNNLLIWVTQIAGGGRGMFPFSPSHSFTTTGGTSVLSIEPLQWRLSGRGLLVGTKGTSSDGHVEVWRDYAITLLHDTGGDIYSDSRGALEQVTSIASGDFNGDGLPDLALGQDNGNYYGRVSVFFATDEPWRWQEADVLDVSGAVLALDAVDMKEDDQNDLDLVVGTSTASSVGQIQLWLNDRDGKFGDDGSPSDWIDAGGEVLSLATAEIDPDVFPDVIAGLRTAQYSGALNIYKGTGFLPSAGTEWSHTGSGEVATLVVHDFNIDGLKDVAVGTRTALSTGQLVVYFGTQGGTL